MEDILDQIIAISDEISETVPKEGWTFHASEIANRLKELASELGNREVKKEEPSGITTEDDVQRMIDEVRTRLIAR